MWFEVKRIGLTWALLGVALSLAWAPGASAAFTFESLESTFVKADGSPASEGGTHPFAWTMSYTGATTLEAGEEIPAQSLKTLRVQMPAGLVGSPAALPGCSRIQFFDEACPADSAIGTIDLSFFFEERGEKEVPVYNLEPSQGTVAELGFLMPPLGEPGIIHVAINPSPPFNLEATISEIPQVFLIYGVTLTLHGTLGDGAFLTLPRSCDGPLTTGFEAVSWDEPEEVTKTAVAARDPVDPAQPLPMTGCSRLGFAPAVKVGATTTRAEAPSGLDLAIDVNDPGLLSAAGTAAADVRGVGVELPEGMAVNPAVAEGLGVCTPGQYAAESDPKAAGCPESSKVGTADLETPLLNEALRGSVFVAAPDDPATAGPGAENPFDSLLAFYLVLENPARGVVLKQAIAVRADPRSGRLTASLGDLPEVPISHLGLDLRGGPRAPFVTPGACGDHLATVTLTPSSGGAPVRESESLTVDEACGARGFHPALSAGTANPQAGASTSLVLDLRRQDGEQELDSAFVDLPEGLTAGLGTVPLCPEAATIAGGCPVSSKVGFARIAAGAGASPAWIPSPDTEPGSVYLAGPYRGAPFSLAIAFPARAGPFSLGDVLIRAPIFVDRRTGRARVEVDALPQILQGIPIRYRDLRLVLDRSGFVRNPTDCTATTVGAAVTSTNGTSASISDRFQVGNCVSLGFAPRARVALAGPTRRGGHPSLRAVLNPRPGDANLRSAGFVLPSSELLDSRHIRNVCARGEFDVDRCPVGAANGRVEAWTPLLDQPLSGRVFLRESDGRLPDLAVALHGEVDLTLNGHVDSSRGRLRIVFPSLPDVPFSKLVLTMPGGRRGLLANTGGLCARRWRTAGSFGGQNGKRHQIRPVVKTGCGKGR